MKFGELLLTDVVELAIEALSHYQVHFPIDLNNVAQTRTVKKTTGAKPFVSSLEPVR